ncbi:MAG: thiamine phosphate synthase [Bacteroidales bacterium]|nr:thiamine phosphate synthase [Bacteroidales bacterium]
MTPEQLRLYLVTDRPLSLGRGLEWIVEEAVKGGATIVQLREKSLDTREFIELGLSLKRTLAPYGVPLIINDRVDVALAVDADGVHIGQSDMPYDIARRLLGPDKIIGLSVENLEEVEEANSLDVDYIAVSPVFGTPTKTDTAPPFGLDGLRKAASMTRHPVVAIGGMNRTTAAGAMACGIDGIAVVSAICGAPEPQEAARELRSLL